MQKFFSYIYGNNNPLNYIDPQGTIAFLIPVVMGALTLYSAYQTGKALAEGDYKRAAFEAIGLIPVGKVGTLAVKGALKIAPKLVSKGKTLLAAGKNVAKGVVTFARESGVGKSIASGITKFASGMDKAASAVSDFGRRLFGGKGRGGADFYVTPSGNAIPGGMLEKFLNFPARRNGILNIGAGEKPIAGAYNISKDANIIGVHSGDALNLSNIASNSQKRIIFENPHGFDPLNPEVLRVLQKNGVIEIIETKSNGFVNKIPINAQKLGFEVKQTFISNFNQFRSSSGKVLNRSKEFLRFILKRG